MLTALVVLGAVPTVLLLLVGDPFGRGLGHQWDLLPRTVLIVSAATAWLAWAACCVQLTRAVAAQVRAGSARVAPGAGVGDRLAARVAAGILALTTLGAPLALTAGVGAAGPVQSHVGAAVAQPITPAVGAAAAQAAVTVYVVQPDDTLWSIAADRLGDGAEWALIAAMNLDRPMGDGERFIDPGQIRPGWVLELPAVPGADGPAVAPPSPPNMANTADRFATVATAPAPRRSPARHPGPAPLPELIALGVGAMACAAMVRRTRRLRLLGQIAQPEPRAVAVSEGAVDVQVLMARFAGIPALGAFESANRRLARAYDMAESPPGTHGIRAVCVGASGVEFWLRQRGQPAPEGFTTTADGAAWQISHDALRPDEAGPPLLPLALPVGEDERGTWLVPLGPGSCLPLIGDAAAGLARAARLAQEAWDWADAVTVTTHPDAVRDELELWGGAGDDPAHQVIYFGDPAALPDGAVSRIAVVTTAPAGASDLTILVDALGASIHPLGRTVRPHLLDEGNTAALEELARPAPTIATHPRASTLAPQAGVAFGPAPGPVDIRLLTATPRLEGCRATLPPNRARRATELVAYLALHRPDTVTSDRLRTRVLGSGDADAAAKTLFNTAAAARRALGSAADGSPLLPPGSRTGEYRVADEVTVDVQRAAELADAGNAAEDPDMAMAYLRAALDLVEGEPLANALAGYAWWEAEGHGARIAAVLVNAACNLAALGVQAGRYELAQWGLERARLVDPYSEAISRAAMQVAAAAGDADRLRREWRECQRRIDELDPGASPSPRTERLYGELARRVLVGAPGAGDR